MSVIEVHNLHKRYRDQAAVEGVSFSVERGEIFGILGQNGAGKTTTVECIAGLTRPDQGTIRVLGLDPIQDRQELRQRVGVQLQAAHLPAKLRVWEALDLYSSFYPRPADWEALLAALGLTHKRDETFERLSGGQKQRLSIALALVGNPEIAILDELSTGLDPLARRDTWGLIAGLHDRAGLRDRGVTVLLVTHFIDEAEHICDRVAILEAGRLAAIETPAGLAARYSPGLPPGLTPERSGP